MKNTVKTITVNNYKFHEGDEIGCFNMISGKWARCILKHDDSFGWYAKYPDGARTKILTFEAVRVEFSEFDLFTQAQEEIETPEDIINENQLNIFEK